ncbi:adenylate/guanylate cyclase domain-containing protein [Rhodococcus sp. SGAir0479]|uniref:adenylate/guanylate cyclase domain-containing protein n=1 Tax=Rhodococcus sp. SGAir0479 TaxID=2567884 RepID=UPI0010CD2792|nr:adenylate/guanylate cyclase domain-containing protein [Rhodococcus sp. SGAir0479]QCQ90591.1 adenylate/guanylate cyclase domain-containing protein [Rhodococcus sp. SGAir0479]
MHPRRSAATPLGSRLLGTPTETPRIRRIRVQTLLTTSLVGANVIGAAVVAVLLTFVVPGPDLLEPEFRFLNFVVVPVYLAIALLVGTIRGTRRALRSLQWIVQDRTPTDRDRRKALTMPWRLTRMQIGQWSLAFVSLTTAYAFVDPEAIPKVGFTIAFGGITICAFSHVFSEFALRPAAARALETGIRPSARLAGVVGRTLLAWILGTGVPVAGLMIVAVYSYFSKDTSRNQLEVAILGLGAITLFFGLLLILLNARATVAPIRSVEVGMRRIEDGRLDTAIVVYDGTELGELQAGFNRMADGLRERERIRDLFGRHVGHDVAAAALVSPPTLGGEEREVAVFFVDLIGSTELTATRPPREVVTLLNRFFDVVVDEVDRHDGFVNKFEGDAALAIFGAPRDLDDAAGQALSAARAIASRLADEVPECRAAIGVAAGTAVAGNIGARERFEYTVIGDPVNEASRLSELAKADPARLLASWTTVERARATEARNWHCGERVTLRGRTSDTQLARAVEEGSAVADAQPSVVISSD